MSDSTERGRSDWEDQDLLTIDEAGERLRDELRSVREQLAGVGAADPGRDRLERRIRVLEACLDGLNQGPTELARL